MFNEYYEEAQIEFAKSLLAQCGVRTLFVHFAAKEDYAAFNMGGEL